MLKKLNFFGVCWVQVKWDSYAWTLLYISLFLQGCIAFLIIFFSLGSKQLSDLHVKLIYKLVHFYETTE